MSRWTLMARARVRLTRYGSEGGGCGQRSGWSERFRLKQCHGIALVEEAGQRIHRRRRGRQDGYFRYGELESHRRGQGEEDADSIIYDPASKHIFVFNGDPKSATVIDPANGAVVKEHCAGRRPGVCGGRWQGKRFTTTLRTRMKWWRSIPARWRSSRTGR